MKYLFIFLFLVGCDGEPKETENFKLPIISVAIHNIDFEKTIEFLEKIELDDDFEITGKHTFKIPVKGKEQNCEGTVYRKEYKESYFYVTIDCFGNMMQNFIRK